MGALLHGSPKGQSPAAETTRRSLLLSRESDTQLVGQQLEGSAPEWASANSVNRDLGAPAHPGPGRAKDRASACAESTRVGGSATGQRRLGVLAWAARGKPTRFRARNIPYRYRPVADLELGES